MGFTSIMAFLKMSSSFFGLTAEVSMIPELLFAWAADRSDFFIINDFRFLKGRNPLSWGVDFMASLLGIYLGGYHAVCPMKFDTDGPSSQTQKSDTRPG
jgi:hypothetical protein